MPETDPTRRFSNRVDDYRRHRPAYPSSLIKLLRREIGLSPHWIVADIGAGTGISAEPFLRNGNRVIAVEPNREMRAEAERTLGHRPEFEAVDGRAERTGLPEASVDLVLAAQAFHWFDADAARAEFARILRHPGHVVLLWNRRLIEGDPFLEAYEALLVRYGVDYSRVRHDRVGPERVANFLGGGMTHHVLANEQRLDRAGLIGRVRSSSYSPAPDHPHYPAMIEAIDGLFDAHAVHGLVCIRYHLEVYLGVLHSTN